MKAMTITVYFEEGQEPTPVTFGDKVLGGEVAALAAYDMFHTMEIAEAAIDESNDDKCIEARLKMDAFICNR
jgi:hypothetical protein